MAEPIRYVMVQGQRVGVFWPARGGGYTLRSGPSLVRAKIHHFSQAEGVDGLAAYITQRFGEAPQFVEADPSAET